MVLVCITFSTCKNERTSSDINWDPRSECIDEGDPNIANIDRKHLMTVLTDISGHANANGNLENSSINTNKYLFRVFLGSGSL